MAGRLEFCHEREWRAVCEDGWDDRDATTACKELGFSLGEWKYVKPCSIGDAGAYRFALRKLMLWQE